MADNSMVAIITARGGSKRIPRKNIRDFLGKPIIAYSIEAALESELFDEVMVSTDDEEIAEVARNYGAEVPFLRSAETSNDYATTVDVLLEVIDEYLAMGICYEKLCCIYPTAPFVTAVKLIEAFSMLDEGTNSVFTATHYSYPPQRGLVDHDGYLEFWFPRYEYVRSQDLQPIYHDAGQFYYCKTSYLVESKRIIGTRSRAYYVSPMEVQDIDNEDDWELAKAKYSFLSKTRCE